MSGSADTGAREPREVLRDYILSVPLAATDDDGTKKADAMNALAALAAGVGVPPDAERLIPRTPERMDDPVRGVNFRVYRDEQYEPTNGEARLLLERIRDLELARDKALAGVGVPPPTEHLKPIADLVSAAENAAREHAELGDRLLAAAGCDIQRLRGQGNALTGLVSAASAAGLALRKIADAEGRRVGDWPTADWASPFARAALASLTEELEKAAAVLAGVGEAHPRCPSCHSDHGPDWKPEDG